ncbi:unannotated protein [freshwater metagenome]|uniref:Unannotated protein n=1 Tax=freshwater metagenome TaxID=449393 RepID=A0A6J7JMI9_9ZZZZ|nr:hypothetical protein [Actinomycetota bacterium]
MTQRKIDVRAVLAKVFDTYGKTARVLLPLAILLFLPVAIVSALDGAIFQLLGNILQWIASLWFAGIAVKAVQDVHEDGKLDATPEELLRSVGPVLLPLFLVGIVAGVGVAIGLVLLIVPGIILLVLWSVAAPVVVLENPGVFKALGRSRELVRGNAWQVLGVLIVIVAIMFVAVMVLGSIGAIGDSFVLLFIILLVIAVVLAPLQALVQGVLYFALREAHGEQVLSSPTGVVLGFATPVAPDVPATQAAAPAGFEPPSAPAEPSAPAAFEPPQAPAAPAEPAAPLSAAPEPPAAPAPGPSPEGSPGERPGGSIPPPSA